jgi:hypothetical protein
MNNPKIEYSQTNPKKDAISSKSDNPKKYAKHKTTKPTVQNLKRIRKHELKWNTQKKKKPYWDKPTKNKTIQIKI